MTHVDEARLRKLVVDQLESLQLAGVMQLPKAVARGLLSRNADEVASAQEVAMPRKQERVVAAPVATKEMADGSKARAASAEKAESTSIAAKATATAAASKSGGWQPEKATSLFETPPTP